MERAIQRSIFLFT
uniref:Uncharacterized protein n=1 Tax=Lepeophtheirus salmonis TaxID=72036 RepID=A0A0K2TEX4_LEPSM